MVKKWIEKQFATADMSIRDVMKKISAAHIGVAVIVDSHHHLMGLATDSDIRRAILNDVSLERPISDIMVKKPVTLPEGLTAEESIERMRLAKVNRAPIVTETGKVVDIALLWKLQELTEKKATSVDFQIDVPHASKDGKKVLVIGAAGYVGSVVCEELLREGYQVRALDRFLFGAESIEHLTADKHLEVIKGDIRQLDVLVDAAFGVDAVINLAAIVGDPACDLDVNHTILVNYFSAKAAADAAKHLKVDRYLFASTAAVYGASSGKERLTEISPVAPVSLYAETKLKSESGILSLRDKDFSPCVFRLGTVFGLSPRMRFDLVVNLFVLHALTRKKLTVFGGGQYRPYIHVRDIARGMLCALRAKKEVIHGEIFNLGSDSMNMTLVDLAKLIATLIPGTELDIQAQKEDGRDYNVSFEKVRNRIGFEAMCDIKAAVKEIQQAFQQGRFRDFSDKKYSNVKQQEHLIFG